MDNDNREIAEIEVSLGEQSITREIVLEDGAIPIDTELFIQDMVDSLLEKEKY